MESVIAGIPCLHDQSVGPRPGETERQHYAVSFVAVTGLEVEAVSPDDRRGPRAKAARPFGRNMGLVLLETHFKVRITFVAGALSVPGVPDAAATVPVL